MSDFICPTCKSKNFDRSLLGDHRCSFCDGTEGGVGPVPPTSRIVISSYKRGDRLPAAIIVLQCQVHLEVVSNIPAAEVWYKTCAFPDPDKGGKGTVELWARWPCGACNQEHEGRMASW